MRSADLALILTGVLLNAVAKLLLKAGSRAIAGVAFNFGNAWMLFERIAINPPIIGGLFCYGVSGVGWIGFALTEAVANSELRTSLAEGFRGLDRLLSGRIALGMQRGEVDADANPEELGKVASAMLYLLAIQARTGANRKSLRVTMNAALNSICSGATAYARC